MIVPDLPRHVEPLEIVHHARWLDALLEGRGVISNALPRRNCKLRTMVAHRPEQFDAVQELVRRRYAWRGYEVGSAIASEADCGAMQSASTANVTLLAQDGERLLGTLTVRPGSGGRLLAESTYGTEIERLREQGRHVGELVKLAVEEGADWRAALDALVQSAYHVTRVVHALTNVVIEVNPRHVRFYRRVFGFVVAAAEGFCSRVGAPSVLLLLDLEQFARRLQRSP